MDLSGQTVLVTGASRNIGRWIATSMAERGADVGITSHTDRDACEETAARVEATGSESAIALGDLGDPVAIESLVDSIRDELGPIDILVANAAIRPHGLIEEVTMADVDRVAAVNFRGTYALIQEVLQDMTAAGEGSIITVLGTFVYMGLPGFSHGFASKMANAGLVRQLASELGPAGIRVNGVAPGIVNVDDVKSGELDEDHRRIVEATPLERPATPEEIADVCSFLGSDLASFITGQVIHVNGGLYPTPNLIDPTQS